MIKINGTLTFVDKNGEDKSLVRVIDNLTEINIGSRPTNDILIKSDDVEESHCKIYYNEIQKLIIKNYSTSHPILVNGKVVDKSKDLKSGDVITILENSMRWETKDDAKRRISFLSKDERKAIKRKYMKTNSRITIHSVSSQSMIKSSPEEASGSSSAEKFSTPETLERTPEAAEENISPVKEQQVVSKYKENEKTPVKVNKLNMSGTLLTSYTPPAGKLTSRVYKTPYSTPLRSPLVKSAAKSILNDSVNVSKFDSPKSAQKLNNSQMHLIDLTTPFVKRTETTSTPKTSSIRKTPRTIGKTPLRNATLLKSAIKNSSIQKNVIQNVSIVATKGKQLFDSPASRNTPIKEDTSSLIEISMSSVSENDSSKGSINENECAAQKVEEKSGKTTKDEVKDLLESIDQVLKEENGSQGLAEPEEVLTSSQELEEDFNKIVDSQKISIGSINESIFNKALNNVPIEDINDFDKLLTDEGTSSSTDDTEKKGEIVLKFIKEARESLSTSNMPTQIISSRYSNITNESLSECVNTSQKYDATTPKITLLDISDRNKDLTMSPVSRLSLTKDSTEIVENYQLNSNNSESLRSTRKRMRTAMSSIGILNSSQSADTSLNESLTALISDKDQVDLNQSQPEETNILSLDNQPDMNTSNKENEFNGSLNMSIKFLEYSESNENNQDSKIIFEFSNDGDDLIDSDIESESESEDSPNEDILDEPMDDEIIENENNENTDLVDSNNASIKKCRISKADLESLGEDGIDILEQSKDEDQLAEMLEDVNTDMQEVQESETAENNGNDEFEALIETATDSNGVNDFDEIPETKQIELDDEMAEKEVLLDNSEYLDDIPETQQLDFGIEETNSTFNGTIEALDSTKESEPQEDIQQATEELPIENKDVLDETVEDKSLNETNGNKQLKDTEEQLDETVENKQLNETFEDKQLDETIEDSFNDHVEIPATQAFEFDDSIDQEKLDGTFNVDVKEESSLRNFESIGSAFTVNDSTIISSQEPVNKSDSISIQEISDSSEICSQESIIAKQGSSLHPEDIISENDTNEIVNKSPMKETCSKETLKSLESNISETINELIATPTDILTSIAVVQQYSTSEIGSDHMEIPATQEMIYDEFDSEEVVENKTAEGDSAIGTATSSKIDQSNDSDEKRADDSLTVDNPVQNRESALFSDTEFSHVDINASAFLKETDSDDFPEIKNNQELTDNETNKAQIDELEEDKSEKQKELIEKELEKVDFNKKIVKRAASILPSEVQKSSGSRQTMIPERIDDSFAAFIEKRQTEFNESEGIETNKVQDEIGTKNDDLEIESSVNEEEMNEIEKELARMNAEPIVNVEKKRATSMMPQFEDGESSNKVTSRMTIIPSEDNRRTSFLESLEEEKAEKIKQEESFEIVEEKPKLIVEDDEDTQKIEELSSDNQEQKDKEPVVEELCIKKQAYVTTESEKEVTAPETPSKRRVARVNYSELATGSPARSRRARSASTESNGDMQKEPKSAVKHKEKCVKMEPIVEDDMSVQITVTATENIEQVTESSEEVTVPIIEEISTELDSKLSEKEPESVATDEIIEEHISEPVSDEEMIQQDDIINEDNELVPEIMTDDTENEPNESKTSHEHPENLQLMEVPKPENLQLMEVPAPEKLQIMEVTKPDRLQVVEVTKPSQEHPIESNLEDISNNFDATQKNIEISEPIDEEVIAETENIDSEPLIEEHIDEMLESTSEGPESEPIEQIDDEIIESLEAEDSQPAKEGNDEIIDIRESVESIQENPVEELSNDIIETVEKESVESIPDETVQNLATEPEITPESEENVQIPVKEVPSKIAKVEEIVTEPQTPSRKRAKKLNYLELASGSPVRTPRRGRAASTEEKQEKSTKPDLPPTIHEEISENTKNEEIIKSTNDELVTKDVEQAQEVKKKPGRGRKIEQLKPETEDVPTPSKRLRRGVTPVQTQAPVIELEKKSRKRQQKVVESEPENLQDKELEPEVQADEVVQVSSTESIQEAPKPVAKKGRGRQPKVVEEISKEEIKVDEPQQVKKGRGRKAKVDETPTMDEKLPEKIETSPKRGRGRKIVEESHEEKTEIMETPVTKNSRKRQHDKPAETEKSKDTEDINTAENAEEPVKSPQQVKKQNRAQKATEEVVENEQPEKATIAPKRGRKAKLEAVPEIQETQKEEMVPKRAGRKPKTEDIVETNEQPAVQEAQKRGRGRKKVDETPKESENEPEKVEESAQKRTGRKGKNEVAEHSVPQTPTTEESVPKRAVRKGKLETIQAEIKDNAVQETPKRGRKAKVDATPVIQEQQQQTEEIAPKKGGRKGKTETVAESHEEPVTSEAPKKGRGRKKAEEAPKIEEPQSCNVQEEPVPVKKARGRQAKVAEKVIETKTDESEEVETEAPKRGRALKHKVVEPEIIEQPVIKKPRGRQAKQEVVPKEPESSQSIESPKPVKTPVKRKVAAAKHVTIVTPSTMQAHHSKESTKSEEPVVAKRATKRQANPIIEEEPIAAKRSTRVRK
ncbi:unnamed protein product [Chironomus riparius]|uniref:FHA domain-containing protein n=1 Tax=Chironomus riparius TaxID=315576 RepID=A0A9N9S4W6_9DIPT|nr:unnamed protein product [Chironomus riparius]